MPAARSSKEVQQMLEKALMSAMGIVQRKVLADMYEETGDYYGGGQPRMYERTGALGDTPRTTALSKTGDGCQFDAYLDESHQYTTADNPSMTQVLHLANEGAPWTTSGGRPAHPTVGRKGFWDRAQQKMEKTFNETLSSYFN